MVYMNMGVLECLGQGDRRFEIHCLHAGPAP